MTRSTSNSTVPMLLSILNNGLTACKGCLTHEETSWR